MSKSDGCRKPPVGTRYRKGQSGNPKGRPKAQRSNATGSAFDIVIDRTLAGDPGRHPSRGDRLKKRCNTGPTRTRSPAAASPSERS